MFHGQKISDSESFSPHVFGSQIVLNYPGAHDAEIYSKADTLTHHPSDISLLMKQKLRDVKENDWKNLVCKEP